MCVDVCVRVTVWCGCDCLGEEASVWVGNFDCYRKVCVWGGKGGWWSVCVGVIAWVRECMGVTAALIAAVKCGVCVGGERGRVECMCGCDCVHVGVIVLVGVGVIAWVIDCCRN